MQLFNEILFIVTFFVLIISVSIMAVIALLRYRIDALARKLAAPTTPKLPLNTPAPIVLKKPTTRITKATIVKKETTQESEQEKP